MKYPKLVNSLMYKRVGQYKYIVLDCATGEKHELDITDVRFMQGLDGKTSPYEIDSILTRREVEEKMHFLEENDLVMTSRFVRNGLLSFRLPLFKIRATASLRLAGWILNLGLLLSFLPLVVFGGLSIYHNIELIDDVSYVLFTVGSFFGLLIGMSLHEFGHAIAGLGFKARVLETGLIVGLSNGAYVMLDYDNVKSRMKRVQILAAGIEMNLSIFGASAIMFGLCPSLASFFLGVAYANLVLALINLLFIFGLDGSQIINQLLGGKVFDDTIDFVWDKKVRKDVLSQGVTGYVKAATCVIGLVSQLAYPVLLIINVISIGSIF